MRSQRYGGYGAVGRAWYEGESGFGNYVLAMRNELRAYGEMDG